MVKCNVSFEVTEENADKYKDKIINFDGPGIYYCQKEACGIARCTDVCRQHIRLLITDNKRRINKGIDIPNNLETLKLSPYWICHLKKLEENKLEEPKGL